MQARRNTAHRTTRRFGQLMVAALLGTATLALSPVAPAQAAEDLDLSSGHGITVTGVTKVSERSYRVSITDPNIDPRSTLSGGLAVTVTLPTGYFSSDARYPTVYLLPGVGASDEQYRVDDGLESTSAGSEAVVVTPEGGRAGWYTNWTDQSAGAQNWEKFHINDLIPWVDDNFRTKASGDHRAIGGLSMGGFGAIHYAFKYPSLFNHVSSYSGAVDLEDTQIRAAVVGSMVQQNLTPLNGPFGTPVWPLDTIWKNENPVRHAESLRGLGITMYAGDGLGTDKIESTVLERGAGNATNNLSKRLTALGIPHTFDMYGHDVSYGGYTCNGGHEHPCWAMALAKDWPHIMNDIQ